MHVRFVAGAVCLAALASAQQQPQMTWQGDVDGTAILYVKSKRVQIDNKSRRSVSNASYHFTAPLPAAHESVRVDVAEGRGYVHILDQPSADNDYTAAIAVEDRQPGAAHYSLALYWNADAGSAVRQGKTDRLTWTGRLNGAALVSCRGSECTSEPLNGGGPVLHERVKFPHPLPARDTRAVVEPIEGSARLIEQPTEANGYTTRVQVSAKGDAAFVLSWPRPVGGEAERASYATRGLTWSGRVAGTVRVTVQGGAVFSQAIEGPPVAAEHAAFDRPLPAASNVTPTVRKQRGPGEVTLIESPSSRNGYRLVFEIRNSGSGPGEYEVEVAW